MHRAALFVSGVLVGMLASGLFGLVGGPAQREPDPGPGHSGLNHVGMTVEDLDQTVAFYTDTLGFREAFSVPDAEGNVLFTYVQINQDTFLELFPATGDRPPGFTHVAFNVSDLQGTMDRLRQAGVEVEDPITGRTKAFLTNMTGPDGVRIELLELSPDSLQRAAVDSWAP